MSVMQSTRASYSQKNNVDLGHIPGRFGLPFVGNLLRTLRDPFGFYREQYDKYGELSRATLFTRNGLVALSPDLAGEIAVDKASNFSTRMGYQFSLEGLFDGALLLRDFDEHRFHRRIMQTAFKSNAMQGYIDTINTIIPQFINRWGKSNHQFVAFPAIKELTLYVASRIFIGASLDNDMQKLTTAFVGLLGATTSIIRLDVPGLSYHKGLKAQSVLDAFLKELIPAKRTGNGKDMLTYFCQERDENGELFSDDVVVEHLRFLMLAAHDTVASALINTFYLLAAHPDWQQRVREEARALQTELVGYEKLNNLVLLEYVFKEVLRLFPPANSFLRRTVKECQLGGYRVPENTVLTVPMVFVQRMHEWWDNPMAFDPMRFAPPREEHKRHAYSWMPFGGGAHKCIGMHFALVLYKCIIAHAIQSYEFRLQDEYPAPEANANLVWAPILKPRDGLPLILKPLASTAR